MDFEERQPELLKEILKQGSGKIKADDAKQFIALVRKALGDDKIRDWNLLRKHKYVLMDEYDYSSD